MSTIHRPRALDPQQPPSHPASSLFYSTLPSQFGLVASYYYASRSPLDTKSKQQQQRKGIYNTHTTGFNLSAWAALFRDVIHIPAASLVWCGGTPWSTESKARQGKGVLVYKSRPAVAFQPSSNAQEAKGPDGWRDGCEIGWAAGSMGSSIHQSIDPSIHQPIDPSIHGHLTWLLPRDECGLISGLEEQSVLRDQRLDD